MTTMVNHITCKLPTIHPKVALLRFCINKGVTGIFFWGGKVIFPWFFPGVKYFFPVENSHFGTPKTNFRHFQKWKAKKEKRGKRSSTPFVTFPPSLLQFSFFCSQFSPHFSLPLFSQYVGKNFPVRSLWGALCPPACYATVHKDLFSKYKYMYICTYTLLFTPQI